jgi:hypothetical protein
MKIFHGDSCYQTLNIAQQISSKRRIAHRQSYARRLKLNSWNFEDTVSRIREKSFHGNSNDNKRLNTTPYNFIRDQRNRFHLKNSNTWSPSQSCRLQRCLRCYSWAKWALSRDSSNEALPESIRLQRCLRGYSWAKSPWVGIVRMKPYQSRQLQRRQRSYSWAKRALRRDKGHW